MKVLFSFTALSLFIITGSAQMRMLTIEEATSGKVTNLRPESVSLLQWRSGTAEYSYVKNDTLMLGTPKKGEDRIGLSLDSLRKILEKSAVSATLKSFPGDYTWTGKDEVRFSAGNKICYVSLKKPAVAQWLQLPENAALLEIHDASGQLACTVGNNIWISPANGEPYAVTRDTLDGIVNGDDYVHRQEFGIHKGLFWSPNGKYLAYYRKDETMVTQYPLVNTTERIAEATMIRYPMAGMTSEQVTLVVYNPATRQSVTIKTGEPKDQYLTGISWDPTEKYIYIGILNREQNHLKMNQYDIATGALVQTLFEEKHDRYVEPENPMLFLPDGSGSFIWQSERDGYNHLYLYSADGKTVKALTAGSFEITEVLGFDHKNKWLFYMSTEASPLERQLYRLDLATGDVSRITSNEGTHACSISFDGKWVLDQYSSVFVPNVQQVLAIDGSVAKTLVTATDPLGTIDMPDIQMVELTAADGVTKLYGRLISPKNRVANTQYPVIVYVYGGPHLQLVTNSWLGGAGLWDFYMAQRGFVVFTVDNRGSAHRGLEFESVIHRNLGQAEMADQMQGVDYLKSLSYVDSTRIGVYGWSYGGFMSTSLMTTHPDVFKVGVAGGPVIDWKYYEVMYGERYMDTPQENPDGYTQTSLLNKAPQLEGPMLIIHGAQDPVVVWQQSLQFINECINAGKPVDYFVYPSDEHNVRGKRRVHLLAKIADYFEMHLK